MRTPWLTTVRREWAAITGGPVSLSWWLLRALGRVVFMVALVAVLALLYFDPPVLGSVLDGGASPLALLPWALTTPTFLGVLAVVAVLAFVLPFLPDSGPHDG